VSPAVTAAGLRHGVLLLDGLAREPVPLQLSLRWTCDGREERWEPVLEASAAGWRAAGPGVELALQARRTGAGLVIGWELECTGGGELQLEQVVWKARAGDWPLLAEPAGLRLFQNGFQSWTPSGSVAGDARPAYPLLKSFSLMNHCVDSPLWGRKDGLISSLFTLLSRAGEPALLAGFTTQEVGLGELFYRNRGEPELWLSLDYGGKRLQPGARLEGEALYLALGEPVELLDRYSAEAARCMQARPCGTSPVGWCSWYEYYSKVRERDVLDNLELLAEKPWLGLQLLQLDDGFQPEVGDWLEVNHKFPRGLAPLAAEVKARGLQAGLWTAPFFASRRSRLFREHRGWFLETGGGRLVDCGYNPVWNRRLVALDPTHPEVRAWLEDSFGQLAAQGFDYFKIDFLFAGLRRGLHRDPQRSPVEAYRMGVQAVRRGIGEGRFLLGCGAPIGPSIGLFDAMRVSQDVKEEWESRLAAYLGRGCGFPSARGALRSNMTRWFMHRRWWLNDPDCLLVRRERTKLCLEQVRTLATILGCTGGMLFLSDDMTRVDPERLRLAEAVLPPTPLTGRPSRILQEHYPRDMWVDGHGGRRLLVLVNWGDEPERRQLPELGAGTWFDFWEERVVSGGPVRLPRHGVRALRFVPAAHRPQLVGDSLHLTAQVDGRLEERWDADRSALRLCCGSVARRRGGLWLRLPAAWRLADPARGLEPWSGGVRIPIESPSPWSLALAFCPAE